MTETQPARSGPSEPAAALERRRWGWDGNLPTYGIRSRSHEIAYALGAAADGRGLTYANETPNILYELLLGGILTATLLRSSCAASPTATKRRGPRSSRYAVALLVITIIGVAVAPLIVRVYTIDVHSPTADDRPANSPPHGCAAHAPDLLLRHDRA